MVFEQPLKTVTERIWLCIQINHSLNEQYKPPSEVSKERYKKQLYNIFTRRNSHIQDDVQ